jgi:DHA1 family bicyclomycin/chloramphenicol resistance-like MFS transporter
LQGRGSSVGLLALLLAGLAMLGPFSVDTYLPSFPAIERDFSVTPLQVQQTLTAYLATFALMTLFHGTVSDSFGRRPVVLANLLLFTAATIGCALAPDFKHLLAFRAVQGLSAGAGIVVGRAIIRDRFEGFAAQRLMSLVTMIFGLAPAIAPVIGGRLQSWFGWHSIFVFLACYGALMLVVCWFRLPETHPPSARQPFTPRSLATSYLRLARSRLLQLLCLTVAFNFSGGFLYVASAPAILYGLLERDANDFALLFVPGIAGIMLGAGISGRTAGRIAPRRTVGIAFAIMFTAAAGNAIYHALAEPTIVSVAAAFMGYGVGMALAMPSLTIMALDLFPAHRGTASSLQGFVHTGGSAVTTGVIAPHIYHDAGTLALGMLLFAAAGWVSWTLYLRFADSNPSQNVTVGKERH